MREIKFRAWDKRYSMMSYPNTLSFFNAIGWLGKTNLYYGAEAVGVITEKYNAGKNIHEQKSFQKHFEVMQYTGLKDKNGKEIYEGDILQFPSKFTPPEVVTFEHGMFYLKNDTLFHYADGEEVIGNIYENPELLKEKAVK